MMDNEFQNFTAEDMPHVSEHLSRVVDGAMYRSAIEDKFGDKMERSLGLSEYPDGKPTEDRPVSDPAPYGFDAPPDAEDHRTDADKLEDGLERIFGKDEAEQPQRPAPKPKAAKEA